MKHSKLIRVVLVMGIAFAGLAGASLTAQDKATVKVPDGFGFAEFKGYEDWQAVATSQTDAQHVMRLILANPVMIKAYREGVPANGKPFPGGSKIAKIEWQPKSITDAPFSAATPDTVPGSLKEVEFIQKDSKRFADSNGGWGYAAFTFDDASNTFTPHWYRLQVRDRLPQACSGKGLYFYGVPETIIKPQRKASAVHV